MNTSVNVLMINAQGIMLSVLGRDYFLSYNRVPVSYTHLTLPTIA